MSVPMMSGHQKFALGMGAAFLLLFSADPAFAQATKCMVNGKALYTDGPCPAGAKEDRMKSERVASVYPGLPEVQRGRWEFDSGGYRDGDPYVERMCGNPLSIVAKEIERVKSQGCAVEITNPAPNTTQISISCKPGSGSVSKPLPSKYITEWLILRRSVRSLTVSLKSNDGERKKAEMNRKGDC